MSKRTKTVPMNRFPTSAAPVGTVTGTCCPKMAGVPYYWSGAGPVTTSASRHWSTPATVDTSVTTCPITFGFDDRTNMPEPDDRSKKEYWNRSGAPGTSGGRRDLDGSTWVCVGVGQSANVELRFIGHASVACINNVTITVDDSSKATVAPAAFTTQSSKLSIQGVAEGECTITAICNTKPIGWCHASIYNPGVATVSVWRVNLQDVTGANLTSNAPITAADITAIRDTLNKVYGQCAVSWIVQNGGMITYTTPTSVTNYNNTLAKDIFPSVYAQFFSDFAANSTPSAAPGIDLYYFEPIVFAGSVTAYHGSGGVANGIPSRQCMIFASITSAWGQELLPHELGHCLGLFHPNDSRSSSSQLPDNFRLPMATTGTGNNSDNTMYSDHINLMGYGAGSPPNSSLRYGQWKTVQSTI